MTTIRLLRLLPFIFAACSTIDPADVAADRNRWTAVRDTTADGVVDAREAPLLAELLVAWDQKLTADENAAKRARDPRTVWAEVLRVYGDAAVQVALAEIGWASVAAQHPEAFRLLDRDGDGRLTPSEIAAADPLSPVFALVVTQTSVALLRKR